MEDVGVSCLATYAGYFIIRLFMALAILLSKNRQEAGWRRKARRESAYLGLVAGGALAIWGAVVSPSCRDFLVSRGVGGGSAWLISFVAVLGMAAHAVLSSVVIFKRPDSPAV